MQFIIILDMYPYLTYLTNSILTTILYIKNKKKKKHFSKLIQMLEHTYTHILEIKVRNYRISKNIYRKSIAGRDLYTMQDNVVFTYLLIAESRHLN